MPNLRFGMPGNKAEHESHPQAANVASSAVGMRPAAADPSVVRLRPGSAEEGPVADAQAVPHPARPLRNLGDLQPVGVGLHLIGDARRLAPGIASGRNGTGVSGGDTRAGRQIPAADERTSASTSSMKPEMCRTYRDSHVQHLMQPRRELRRLARISGVATDEAAVVAREHDGFLAEQCCHPGGGPRGVGAG
jgi:hypothetical protein